MNGPVSRITRLACPHTNCAPGSAECQRREDAEMASRLGSAPHPTARHDEMPAADLSSARAAARNYPLPASLVRLVFDDARQQRDNARGLDKLFGDHGHEAMWSRQNPGLAQLLGLLDL